MNRIIYYVSITLLTIVSSCGNKETNVSRKLTLDNCPVIAQVINLQGDPVTNLDFSSVKDTFNLSLSSLLSSFQVIHQPTATNRERLGKSRSRSPDNQWGDGFHLRYFQDRRTDRKPIR